MKSPDYSPYAKQYAESRPRYPEELFEYLSELTIQQDAAWDCATGNGQAALSLTDFFTRVIATDISVSQVKNANRHKRIYYFVSLSENAGIKSHSLDLLTAAQLFTGLNLTGSIEEQREC